MVHESTAVQEAGPFRVQEAGFKRQGYQNDPRLENQDMFQVQLI